MGALFLEFVAIMSGMLIIDWAGFAGMKQIAEMFRPWDDDITYRGTLFPRAWLYSAGAALVEISTRARSDVDAVIALLVALSPILILLVMIFRNRISSR